MEEKEKEKERIVQISITLTESQMMKLKLIESSPKKKITELIDNYLNKQTTKEKIAEQLNKIMG